MSPIYRFIYPDERWKKLLGWGRNFKNGSTAGLLIGLNMRAWCLGVEWWGDGFCFHVGPINIGCGWIEETGS